MIFNQNDYAKQLPLAPTGKWKDGVWDVEAFTHGSMSLIFFAPEGIDYQSPHDQDEVYIVIEGSGVIEIEGVLHSFSPGAAVFVAAGQRHQFQGDLAGIKMWAMLYGQKGDEISL